MTALAEIAELKTETDAKFDKVFVVLAEIKTEVHGLGKDMNGMKADMRKLSEFHGIANGEGNDVYQETA